jgi:SAM-dependent methyltransferase
MPDTPALRGSDRLHGTPGEFGVAICPACGSGLTLPVVQEDALGAFYPESYNAYGLPGGVLARAAATALFRARYARGLRHEPLAALRRRAPGRLLDVGGGRGDLGVVLRPLGWQVTSLDPSESACEAARARGVDAIAGTLSTPPPGPFAAVVFQHSLEHVVDPAAALTTAHELLADDGLLLIALPNFACWQARRFGADWFHLDLPRHRTHFTPAGLSAALERAGFTDVSLSTSTTADGLPMSLQYRRFGRRVTQAPGARYVFAGLSLLAAPVTAALNRSGGDVLQAVAVRPHS